MMSDESLAERYSSEEELDQIRIRLHELTKDMTSEERVAFFNHKAKTELETRGIRATIVQAPALRKTVTSR